MNYYTGVKDVYMTNSVDDYCISHEHPNVHIVYKSGNELDAPIYSPRMYLFIGDEYAEPRILAKINELYAEYMKMLREAQEGTLEYFAWQGIERRRRIQEEWKEKARKAEEAKKAEAKKAEEARKAEAKK